MIAPDELLARARAGNAAAAADLWLLIASGKAPQDVALAWLADVAGQVAAKVLNPATPCNRRPNAALKAIGIEGRLSDRLSVLRQDLETFDQFDGPARSRTEVAEVMQLLGHLPDKPLRTAAKTIDRLRKR